MAAAAIGLCSILQSQDHKGNLKSFAWMTVDEAHEKKAHEIRPPVLVLRTSKSGLQVKLMAEGSEEAWLLQDGHCRSGARAPEHRSVVSSCLR